MPPDPTALQKLGIVRNNLQMFGLWRTLGDVLGYLFTGESPRGSPITHRRTLRRRMLRREERLRSEPVRELRATIGRRKRT